jgi:predicted esterase
MRAFLFFKSLANPANWINHEGSAMSDERDFFNRTQEMMACYERGDYGGALAVTERLAAAFPDQSARTDFWCICLLARLGRIDDALQVFRKALDAAMWWSEPTLRSDPDLEPLQGLPEYERIVAVCSKRHAAAQAVSKPVLIVRGTTKAAKQSPVLITLHGQGSTAASDLANWEKACPLGWLVAAMQSSQMAWPGAYAWNDREQAQEEVVGQFENLCAQYPVDRSRVIIGGFSQGAALAIRLTLNGSIPARGFLSVTPGMIDRQLLTGWADTARDHAVRGYLIAGSQDRRYEFFKQTCEILPEHGISCRMEDHPELGHEFPPDFEKSLKKALRFLLS